MLSFYLSQHHSEKIALGQDWIRKAERIRCSAPLLEGSPDPVLTRMLERAPYQVSSGEDEGRHRETESGLHTLHIQTGGISVSAKEDNREGESRIPPPHGKKRAASEDWEGRSSKNGKMPPSIGLGLESDAVEQLQQGDKPSAKP